LPFPPNVTENLLVKSGRCCCLCRTFKGQKIEIHHIISESDGGLNNEENGIPLCFDCHSDVQSYNNKHPKGRKFRPSELKRLRNQWFELVANGKAFLPGSYDNREKQRKTNEVGILVLQNFKKRIAMHNQAFEKIVLLSESGDMWWADKTDYVFDALHEIGEKLDRESIELLNMVREISPLAYNMCGEFIEFEKNKRSVMKSYLMIPDDRLKSQMGFTFNERYSQILSELEKGWNHIKNYFEELLKE